MITFKCPTCQQPLNAPEELRGKTFTCPHCSNNGVVPSSTAQSGTLPLAAPGGPHTPEMAATRPSPKRDVPPPLARSAGKSVSGRADRTSIGQFFRHFVVGLGVTVLVYLLLIGISGSVPSAQKFTSRGWTPYVAMLLTFWSLAVLTEKAVGVRRRHKSLDATFLADDAVLNTAAGIEEAIAASRATSRKYKDVILGHRIRRALEHFKATWNVKEVGDILREESESDFAAVNSSYSMVRLFVWTIPILGFIGTVMGVSAAVGGFASFLSAAREVSQITDALTGVTAGLSVAFDTTFVALLLSVIVMLAMSSVEKMEEDQLQLFEDYCQNRVLRRLPALVGNGHGGRRGGGLTEEELRPIIRELVPGIEAWQGEAQRLAAALAGSLTDAWGKAGEKWFEGLASLQEQLVANQARQQEWFETMAQERAALDETVRGLMPQVRDLMQTQQDSLKQVLEVEQKAVTEAVQKQHNMVQGYVGAMQGTAGRLSELVELQNKLEEGLLRAAGSDGLARLMGEVRDTLQKLDPAIVKLANEPLDVKVSFVAGAVATTQG